jgi:signal transduction histidine kinase
VAALLNGLLLVLVLLARHKGPEHTPFAGFLAAMGLWALTIFAMRSSPGLGHALAWERVVLPIFPAVSLFFFHFVLRFTGTRSPRWFLPLAYGGTLVLSGLGPTPLILQNMREVSFGYVLVPGPLFLPWMGALYLTAVVGFVILVRFIRTTRSLDDRNRAQYILVGVIYGWLGAGSDYLAATGLYPYPGGIFGNILFAIHASIPLIRYRLPYLRSVGRRVLAYLLWGITLLALYTATGLFHWWRQMSAWEHAALGVVQLLVLAISFRPLLRLMQNLVDWGFYRQRREHLKALQQFGRDMSSIIDIALLSSSLTSLVRQAMGADGAYLFLYSPEREALEPAPGSGSGPAPIYHQDSLLMERLARLSRLRSVITREDLDFGGLWQALDQPTRDKLERMAADILVPLRVQTRPIGLLVVSRKRSGALYDWEEREVLRTVASEAAMSLENARLYDLERRRVAELEELQQARSDFIQAVAHQLKTPITVIKAATSMMAEALGRKSSADRAELLNRISSGTARLEKQVSDLLEFLKIRSATIVFDPEPTEINGLVTTICNNLLPSFRARKQTIQVHRLRHSPRVVLDQFRFGEILSNLLSNAGRFTPEGGYIEVRVRADETNLIVEVSDSGPGIPEEEQSKIFDAYYQARSGGGGGREGFGLGLAIAKSLVELQGGSIWVESRLGEGSTFSFSLPLSGPPKSELTNMADDNRIESL